MFALDTLIHRLRQGCQTISYPQGAPPALPDRHGGALRVDSSRCEPGCTVCVSSCPTSAIQRPEGAGVVLDLGRCVFCAACVEVCPAGAIVQGGDYRMATSSRRDLLLGEGHAAEVRLAGALEARTRRVLGRALRLRQVSAGGCNACEADTNVLGTIGWDLARFGIQFVASPRHADGLLITGPVTRNMRLALEKTYAAVPPPKVVIAVGACAIAGGPFAGSAEVNDGVRSIVPVDLYIPGCPPHPLTILDGLLRLLGRLGEAASTSLPGAAAAQRPSERD